MQIKMFKTFNAAELKDEERRPYAVFYGISEPKVSQTGFLQTSLLLSINYYFI